MVRDVTLVILVQSISSLVGTVVIIVRTVLLSRLGSSICEFLVRRYWVGWGCVVCRRGD